MMIRVSLEDRIKAVRAFANANYEKGGWDNVVEAWSDADITEVVGKCWTENGAVAEMKKAVKVFHAYASDIAATAF